MAKTRSIFFVVVLVALSYELTTATNTCTWGFFKCGSSTQCIVSRRRCDGVRHCTNGADESGCPSRCSGYFNNFKCSNGFCISRSYLCNGVNNCRDSSDESTSLCGGTVFPVRLVGGSSPNQGRVEVYYAEDRTWGTVCDDNWDINDANVVCRQLGLPSATQAVGSARFGQGSGPVLLDSMRCSGTETSLSKCSSSGWKAHDCSHSEDAGVVCGGSILPPLSGGLRCYSCSSSSSSCSTTTTCSSWQRYCYKKTADRTIGGSTSRVTVAGCTSSCTSADRTRACYGQANCQMTCCSSSLCNHLSGGGDSSYPSCYTCSSSSSYKDCDAKGSLTTCASRNSYCYKMDYKTKSVSGGMHFYSKGCTYSSSSCSQMRSTYCNSLVTDECKVYCCSGKGCNGGSVQRFSIAALLTCAVASAFYNLNLHANF